MLQRKSSSTSSVETSAFDTISIETSESQEKTSSLFSTHLINWNQNAIEINENFNKDKSFSHRYAQSTTDLVTNPEYSFSSKFNEIRSKTCTAIRIESALLTSTYSPNTTHSLKHAHSLTMNRNMNQTLDLIDRTGAGDENISQQNNDKWIQTTNRTDPQDYLRLEAISIQDRHSGHYLFKSKRFLLISICVLVCLVFLCLTTVLFIM